MGRERGQRTSLLCPAGPAVSLQKSVFLAFIPGNSNVLLGLGIIDLYCVQVTFSLNLATENKILIYILQVRKVKQKGGQRFIAIRARKTAQVCLTLRSTHFLNTKTMDSNKMTN